MIEAILTNTMLPHIAKEFLTRTMDGRPFAQVHVSLEQGEFAYDFN